MNIQVHTKATAHVADSPAARVHALDWIRITDDLALQGSAVLEGLLSSEECRAIASVYPQDDRFRSKIAMGRHGFGSGEYKYFAYPLPDLVEEMRTALYPQLVPIANQWNELMRIGTRYPAEHTDFLDLCHKAG